MTSKESTELNINNIYAISFIRIVRCIHRNNSGLKMHRKQELLAVSLVFDISNGSGLVVDFEKCVLHIRTVALAFCKA